MFNLDALHKLFPGFNFSDFPEELCVTPDPQEKYVLNGPKGFVVLISGGAEHSLEVTKASPYKFPDGKSMIFAWEAEDGLYCSHHTNRHPQYFDHQVVGWAMYLEGGDAHL